MVNKGQIHREIRKFLMYSSKLIKSDDELLIEIGENGKLWKITSNQFQGIKNHRIWTRFVEKSKIEVERKFRMKKSQFYLKFNEIV